MERNLLILIVLSIFIIVQGIPANVNKPNADPDEFRNVTELITSKGYPCIDYKVTTADGYILSVQRIPNGLSEAGKPAANKPVIYLQHGLLDSASTWVMNSAEESLGFILADNGFDVWLGNSRGNNYCLAHTHLNPNDTAFWEFTWDDMAKYDLPAKLGFVLTTTGASNLTYVGHSEGTETAFAAFSTNAALAAKINLFVALAPVAFLGNIGTTLLSALASVPEDLIYDVLGNKSVLASSTDVNDILPFLCQLVPDICENGLCLIAGCESFGNVNQSRFDVYMAHFPFGSSVNNLVHYAQSVDSNLYQEFNFGSKGNMQHYNQSTPPLYPLQKLIPKALIYYGELDLLADPTDVKHMLQIITTSVQATCITNYGHADFVWGEDANERLYTPMLAEIKKILGL